ncbi:MAG: tRNA dihydrouridine(20/20a) synthase DusA, partial [Nevskiales bacterium]
WRRHLTNNAHLAGAGCEILLAALACVGQPCRQLEAA